MSGYIFRDRVETYTHEIVSTTDNDSTFVTVVNVSSGRGVLIGVWYEGSTSSETQVRITIDGGAAETDSLGYGASATYPGAGATIWETFTSSLLVEMRGTATVNMTFGAVVLTE